MLTKKVWTFVLSGGGDSFTLEVGKGFPLEYNGKFQLWKFFGTAQQVSSLREEIEQYCSLEVYGEEESEEMKRARNLLAMLAKGSGNVH